MVRIRELLSMSKLMQTLPLHYLLHERQHEFADCVHALDNYCVYCVSGIQIMQGLSAGICPTSGEYSLG